jgi:putative Ca2+/H+ antiporter (TMEM165/GDT1 family)
VASASALVLASAIAVLAGSLISAHLNEKILFWIAGCGFIAIGLWTIFKGG